MPVVLGAGSTTLVAMTAGGGGDAAGWGFEGLFLAVSFTPRPVDATACVLFDFVPFEAQLELLDLDTELDGESAKSATWPRLLARRGRDEVNSGG